jgi:DNA-binding FadR family transcriptional regulator
VLEQLQRQLASGAWQVGDRIPGEYDLSAQLQVSRPAVREALRALSHVGVLDVRRGDGTYVRSTVDPRPLLRRVELATLRDVFEVQLAYDVQAARLAARRRTKDDVRRLEDLLADRDAAEVADAFGDADARFHLGVAEASHNSLLVEAFRYFHGRLRESLSALRLDRSLPESGSAAHRAVADAIEAQDVELAGKAAAQVVEPTLDALEALL